MRLVIFLVTLNLHLLTQVDSQRVSAIISLGDSYQDVGNNNYLPIVSPGSACNQPPYGREFDTRQPTGRFSDGRLIIDIIAKGLQLPFALPYLDPRANGQNLLYGVNFASGGAGLLTSTSKLQKVISMNQQVRWFNDYKQKLISLRGTRFTEDLLEDALYFLSVGSNDYVYKIINIQEAKTDFTTFKTRLISNYTEYINDIYFIGARRFIIFALPPLGCIPGIISLFGDPLTRECVGFYNDLTVDFNSALSVMISNLQMNLPGSKFIYLDGYSIVLDLVQNPSKYGFIVTNKGCCGTGLFEFGRTCNGKTPVCPDGSKYVYFDGAHGSFATYSIVASRLKSQLRSELGISVNEVNI